MRAMLVAALGLTAVLSFTLTGCDRCIRGSGTIASESRKLAGFHGIELAGAGTVYITQNRNAAVKVTTDANVVSLVETRVRDGILVISQKKCVTADTMIRIDVTLPTIRNIAVTGPGTVQGTAKIKAENLELRSSGSGEIDLGIDAGALVTRISGSGDTILRGRARTHDLEISGSGYLRAQALSVRRADANLTGSGNARLAVAQTLNARISGSGELEYSGKPKVTSTITGSGGIRNR